MTSASPARLPTLLRVLLPFVASVLVGGCAVVQALDGAAGVADGVTGSIDSAVTGNAAGSDTSASKGSKR